MKAEIQNILRKNYVVSLSVEAIEDGEIPVCQDVRKRRVGTNEKSPL